MPAGAPADQVQHDELLVEHEVELNMLIKPGRHRYGLLCGVSWRRPRTTLTTCVNDHRDHVEDIGRKTTSLKCSSWLPLVNATIAGVAS